MSAALTAETDVRAAMREIGAAARAAARVVANAPAEQKTRGACAPPRAFCASARRNPRRQCARPRARRARAG